MDHRQRSRLALVVLGLLIAAILLPMAVTPTTAWADDCSFCGTQQGTPRRRRATTTSTRGC